jgi:hypothetical protein
MIATQRIQVGMIHARKIVTVTTSDHSFQADIDGETVTIVLCTAGRRRNGKSDPLDAESPARAVQPGRAPAPALRSTVTPRWR